MTHRPPGRAARARARELVDPVGIAEVADRLGVPRHQVDVWRNRARMPEPTWVIGGRPAWDWPIIEEWARDTGRGSPEG